MNYTKLFLILSLFCINFFHVDAAAGHRMYSDAEINQFLRSFAGLQDPYSPSCSSIVPSDAYFEIGVYRDSKGKLYINLGRRRSTGRFPCPELMVCDVQLFVDVLGPLLKRMIQEFGTSVHRIGYDGFYLQESDFDATNEDEQVRPAGDENPLARWIAQQNEENSLLQLIRDTDRIEVVTPGETRSEESEGRWVTDGVGLGATTYYVRNDPLMPVACITVKDGEFNLLDYNCGRFLHPGGLVSLREDPQTGSLRNWKRSLQSKGIVIVFGLVLLYYLNSYLALDCPC